MADFPIRTSINSELVDRAGKLKAMIAEATTELDLIKSELIERVGEGAAIEGKLFRLSLSGSDRESLDETAAALRNELYEANTTPQYRTAHRVVTHNVTMRVNARTGKEQAA